MGQDAGSESFGHEPDWPELHARIAASVPPPPVELIRWPCARPVLPLGLASLDQTGAARLRARLPEPQASALATAEMLLGWVTSRWRHTSSTHDYSQDANVVLDRVEGDAEGRATTVPPGEPFPLARGAGEYRATVAVMTKYGTLTPQPLHYRVH